MVFWQSSLSKCPFKRVRSIFFVLSHEERCVRLGRLFARGLINVKTVALSHWCLRIRRFTEWLHCKKITVLALALIGYASEHLLVLTNNG